MSSLSTPSFGLKFAFRGAIALAFPAMLFASASRPSAQASNCADVQKHVNERKAIVARIQALTRGKKKQVDPKDACTLFGRLVVNGNATLKWAEANKDWCGVPDSFVEGMKADHGRAMTLKGQACGAAAKQAEMMRKARQQAQQGGGGLLGGPGVFGEYKIPQGAL